MKNWLKKINRKFISPRDRAGIAAMLKTSPEALREFEKAYARASLGKEKDNFFDVTAKEASAMVRTSGIGEDFDEKYAAGIMERIVDELVSQTEGIRVTGGNTERFSFPAPSAPHVTLDELMRIPEPYRPMLAGDLYRRDLDGSGYMDILEFYLMSGRAKNPRKKEEFYARFNQGLEFLDLDPVMYEILGTNRNSIGYWLPEIARAASQEGFFKIPDTVVVRVPLPILQLTRLEYMSLNPVTLKIVDDWAMRVFGLDVNKDYFIKTGIFSSKYDFRNARVSGEKEVRELGEYLLFIQNQASMYAAPLNTDGKGNCVWFYGAASTDQFAVREYIRDKEGNPCIYNGMPLHTEYRVFVEFGEQPGVLGIVPYWHPEVMKKRFTGESDADTAKMKHDSVIYEMHEDVLMKRYEDNSPKVIEHIGRLIQDVRLPGQWSIDVMQNGDDFYIIDMALACSSALREYLHVLPGRIKPVKALSMDIAPLAEITAKAGLDADNGKQKKRGFFTGRKK